MWIFLTFGLFDFNDGLGEQVFFRFKKYRIHLTLVVVLEPKPVESFLTENVFARNDKG